MGYQAVIVVLTDSLWLIADWGNTLRIMKFWIDLRFRNF